MDNYGHLDVTVTDRGFKHLPPVPARHDLGMVAVYEASHADTPCVWLKVEDVDDREIIVVLEAEKAWALAEQIMYLARNHYQGDATPPWAGIGSLCPRQHTWPEGHPQDVKRPEPARPTRPACRGFAWIGQPVDSCDNCGRAAWEHDYDQRLDRDVPFGSAEPWKYVPWSADLIAKWLRDGRITLERATYLRSLHNELGSDER